jgi:hypothetical protein
VEDVQMDSSRPSNAGFTVLSAANIALLTADTDVSETVLMLMPMR